MNDEKIKEMILAIIEHVDYDIYKDFLPEHSEDPKISAKILDELIEIVKKYIGNNNYQDFFRRVGSPEEIELAINKTLDFFNQKIATFDDLEMAINNGLSKQQILNRITGDWVDDFRFTTEELKRRNKLFKKAGISLK